MADLSFPLSRFLRCFIVFFFLLLILLPTPPAPHASIARLVRARCGGSGQIRRLVFFLPFLPSPWSGRFQEVLRRFRFLWRSGSKGARFDFPFFFFIFSFCYLFRSGLSPQTGVFVSAVRFFSFLPQVLLQSMIGGFFFILSERCLLVWCVMLGLVHLTLSCRVVSSCSVRCGYGCGCAGVRLCCVCEAIQGLVDRWRGELRNLCVFVTDDCT